MCINGYIYICINPSKCNCVYNKGFPGGSVVKEPICCCSSHGFSPWVGKIPWRRAWQPAPVSLPGESHGRRSLAGYKELDMTERTCACLEYLGGKIQSQRFDVYEKKHKGTFAKKKKERKSFSHVSGIQLVLVPQRLLGKRRD